MPCFSSKRATGSRMPQFVERRETVRTPDAGNAKRICEVVNSVFCSFSAESAHKMNRKFIRAE
jgi:hypothetical protein